MKAKLGTTLAILLAILCVLVAAKAASHPALQEVLASWTARGGTGLAGMTVFAVAIGVLVVFFFPGSILMTASGAAFGLLGGFVTAQVGASLGAGLAFLVSRYVARHRVERWVVSRPRFAAVDDAIGAEGWKIVLLTRCCPIFPYIFQNYAYGLTRVSFGQYALGSFFGIVPATLVFAYLGAMGRTGAAVAAGQTSPAEVALKVLGLVATIAVSVYIGRLSKRALARAGV
jgi:uncharacterized membrane protein YdjX (TVP38/TMEM64 family)